MEAACFTSFQTTCDAMNALPEINLNQLRKFHEAHFTGQGIPPLPETSTGLPTSSTSVWQEDDEDDEGDENLGWYHDGVKRTLTDEQVAMFRHSEIHRLLQHRRLNANLEDHRRDAQENEEPKQNKQAKREKRNKRPSKCVALQFEEVKLDYGQASDDPALESDCMGQNLKIARSMQESDQPSVNGGVDGGSSRTYASQSFQWPKLGS